MVTLREAIQRLHILRMNIRRHDQQGNWIISYDEDRGRLFKDNHHITDDLDDAVITAGRMRHRRLIAI